MAHLYEIPVEMDEMLTVAESFGVPVIGDAAQAAGGRFGGRPLGALGTLPVLSFGRGKEVTGGKSAAR